MIRQTVYFAGRVQGVGFRLTTANLAKDFAVAGTVRNLPDGRVELIVEGEAKVVAGFLEAVREAMSGNIAGETTTRSAGTGAMGRPGDPGAFRILR